MEAVKDSGRRATSVGRRRFPFYTILRGSLGSNDWTKSTGGQGPGPTTPLTDTKLLQQEYWAALREYMIEKEFVVKPTKPLPQHWMNFAIGRSNFQLQSFANTKEARIALGLTMTGPDAKAHFHLLFQEREEIEEEFGESLEWLELPERQESRIMLHDKQADPSDRDDWPNQHAWLSEKLEKFDSVFRTRVKQLDATMFDSQGADESGSFSDYGVS